MSAAAVLLMAAPLFALQDPNGSQQYPQNGYGMIICGNTSMGDAWSTALNKDVLRGAFRIMTQQRNFEPNNVWVLVDNGQDNWTEGLFDAQPATQQQITQAFVTIGQRMRDDPNTPPNIWLIIAGHGTRYEDDPPLSTLARLANWTVIYDRDFVNECLNRIHDNSHSTSPIERLDVLMTGCFCGGFIDDFRDNFQALRGRNWPNARHLSVLTTGDCYDIVIGIFGLQWAVALGDPNVAVPDLNGDGVSSIYECYDYAARNDLVNPTDANYVCPVPDVLYVPSDWYLYPNQVGYAEHPLYYEWNIPPGMAGLTVECVFERQGHVETQTESDGPDAGLYSLGTEVTLTAVAAFEERPFAHWEIYDPNLPSDANHVRIDANNPITIVMDGNRQIRAVFTCGNGSGMIITILPVGALMLGRLVRRKRRRLER